MDNLSYFIYLCSISDDLKIICLIFVIIFVGFLLIFCGFMLNDLSYYDFDISRYQEDNKLQFMFYRKFIKILSIFALCFELLYIAIPSGKTLAAMYVFPRIANNEDIQHITNDNLKSLRFLSEKWLIELIRGNDKKGDK